MHSAEQVLRSERLERRDPLAEVRGGVKELRGGCGQVAVAGGVRGRPGGVWHCRRIHAIRQKDVYKSQAEQRQAASILTADPVVDHPTCHQFTGNSGQF